MSMISNNINEEIEEVTTVREKQNIASSSFKKGGVNNNYDMKLEESEDADGLIKWAKNLPDDI